MADHDPVAVCEDGLGQMVYQQWDIESQCILPMIPGKKLLPFARIDEEQSSADTYIRQRLAQDSCEALLLRVHHQNIAGHDHSHHLKHSDGYYAQIPILELLLSDPKQDARVEKDIQHQHHHKGRRKLQKAVQILAEGKI